MYEFGEKFRFTLFGTSHGPCVGGILEGVPAGFPVDADFVRAEMELRKPRPGIGTRRGEEDEVEFVCGISEGRATGRPILMKIANGNTDGSAYLPFADTPRPGHSDLPALIKFPNRDIRGGGCFSGRLTAPIVAAGAIAKQILSGYGIGVDAYVRSVGKTEDSRERSADEARGSRAYPSRACDGELDRLFVETITDAANSKNSVGGTVECIVSGLPIGFGGIWFEALDAELARAMFGIPGCKGVEFGDGFGLSRMTGSESNDGYRFENGKITTLSNRLGGIAGGMCDGAPVKFRVAFKPAPSIGIRQKTISLKTRENREIEISGRHDPCIVPRAAAAVEAMAALTIADQMARGFRRTWKS